MRAAIGQEPVTLQVDTGAERTLLTEAAVERLALPRNYGRATRTSGVAGSAVAWDALLPKGLALGNTWLPVDRVTVGRFDMDGTGRGTDGLLGADILLAFDVDLDLPAGRMTLYRTRGECAEATPPWNEAYDAVAGVRTVRDRLLVPFQLDGVDGMAVLDTGAQITAISARMAGKMGLADVDLASDRTAMARGAAPGRLRVPLHRFHELRVGQTTVHAPLLLVVPASTGLEDGVVGADYLQGRRVWLSFSTHRMFVTSPTQTGR